MTHDSRSSETPPNLLISQPEKSVVCARCGRTFVTREIELYGHVFPAERYCRVCREASDAEDAERRGETILVQSRVPAGYLACTFGSFEPRPGARTALHIAMEWVKELRETGRVRRGLLFEGPPGAGKTHLASAMIREFVFGRFERALFLNVPEWLNEMRQSIQYEERTELPSPRGFKLVVIDDLGGERRTDWAREQIHTLLNHREANKLPTVVTTSLTTRDLEHHLGQSTMRRLTKLCMPVRLEPSRPAEFGYADRAKPKHLAES